MTRIMRKVDIKIKELHNNCIFSTKKDANIAVLTKNQLVFIVLFLLKRRTSARKNPFHSRTHVLYYHKNRTHGLKLRVKFCIKKERLKLRACKIS